MPFFDSMNGSGHCFAPQLGIASKPSHPVHYRRQKSKVMVVNDGSWKTSGTSRAAYFTVPGHHNLLLALPLPPRNVSQGLAPLYESLSEGREKEGGGSSEVLQQPEEPTPPPA